MDTEHRRSTLTRLLLSALAGVEPERLTREGLVGEDTSSATIIAIGKAAAAMCRGAAQADGSATGICVTDTEGAVPAGIELVVSDHPVPGQRSFEAGRRVLEVAREATGRVVALISGGGSSLCEQPLDGIPERFVSTVNQDLLTAGAPIDVVNLVRSHISEIKNGGVARIARVPVDTYVISDVCGADPAVVASGPTIARPPDPDAALAALERYGIEVPNGIRRAIARGAGHIPSPGDVQVLADGQTAARQLEVAARTEGHTAVAVDDWLQGDVTAVLDRFLSRAGTGITVAAGEPEVDVAGPGRGGRNTHAALLASRRIADTGAIFAAFATDGVDGSSNSAGAIVDGTTTERGGDPHRTLARSDSGSYLAATGDLIETGPTGTNVSDLWVLWR